MLIVFHIGGGGGGGGERDSARPKIVFINPTRDAAEAPNLVTFPKI